MSKTLGQRRVGADFNPSENDKVSQIKQASAKLIDLIESFRSENCSGEKHRAISEAQTHIETGCMFAVKSVFVE